MATQTIRAALARIKAVEETLSITDPETLPASGTLKVYEMVPDESDLLETPCIVHGVTLGPVKHYPNGWRECVYYVTCQFMHNNPKLERAQQIAAAMLAAWKDAFSNDLTLNGTVDGQISYRGNDPTIARLTWANNRYIGFDVVMIVPMNEAVTVGV